MSATHTPGLWRFDAERSAILNAEGEAVAVVSFHGADSMAQENANGCLIADAPELLRVARLALEELEASGSRSAAPVRVELRRIIARQEGGAA